MVDATLLESMIDIEQFQQQLGYSINIEDIMGFITTCAIIGVILSIFPILGGILSVKRKLWGIALACAIIGLVTFIPAIIPVILSIVAIILLVMSRNEFKKVPDQENIN